MAQLGVLQKPSEQVNQSKYSVELKHVKKTYGSTGETEIYADLTFQLLKGTFVALVGPIGSGKTTMVNMFAGLERPTSGTITVLGQDITRMDEDSLAAFRASTVGLVPQVQTLIPELTVYENVELPLHFAKVDKESRRDKVDKVLERVGIRGEADKGVAKLSVGEKQMVSFARALVNDPPILLMDEPTEALDPLMSEVVLGLLRGDNMTEGRTIFVTTHDKRVTDLARRTLRVNKKIP
ncbi:MAG: ABC transporter ATP-binding protein [Thaumarchaeota archaeon]|nr:ABC transporter ATP-binding protein [Nitrososphaerota archaeon]